MPQRRGLLHCFGTETFSAAHPRYTNIKVGENTTVSLSVNRRIGESLGRSNEGDGRTGVLARAESKIYRSSG